jgi:hypothetical protein
MSGSHWWYLLYKELKSWDSTTWFRVGKFWTPAGKQYVSSVAYFGWSVSFLGVIIGVLEKESQGLSNGTYVASWLLWQNLMIKNVLKIQFWIQIPSEPYLDSPNFFCLHICSLCMEQGSNNSVTGDLAVRGKLLGIPSRYFSPASSSNRTVSCTMGSGATKTGALR